MDAQIDVYLPFPSRLKGKHAYPRERRKAAKSFEDSFRCKYCHAYVHAIPAVAGVQNRNHCPYCLWSRHLDLTRAGDRLAACKGTMQPIGLTMKHERDKYGIQHAGELMLIHRCTECGRISINRIAADDADDIIMSILQQSASLELITRHQLAMAGIHVLQSNDKKAVESQLYGKCCLAERI